MSTTLSLLPSANTNITSVELPSRTTSLRFCSQTTTVTSHRPGLPNLVGGGSAGRRHCQPSLWPRPTPINCTNGKSTVRSSQPKMMYRRFRGTYTRESANAAEVLLDLPPLKIAYVYIREYKRGLVVTKRRERICHFASWTHPSSEAFECHRNIRRICISAVNITHKCQVMRGSIVVCNEHLGDCLNVDLTLACDPVVITPELSIGACIRHAEQWWWKVNYIRRNII